MLNQNQPESNAPDLGTLVKPGRNAGTAAEPIVESEPVDLTRIGGVRIPSPPAGHKPVNIAHLYGEHGGPVN
jgi:hypothetical protein